MFKKIFGNMFGLVLFPNNYFKEAKVKPRPARSAAEDKKTKAVITKSSDSEGKSAVSRYSINHVKRMTRWTEPCYSCIFFRNLTNRKKNRTMPQHRSPKKHLLRVEGNPKPSPLQWYCRNLC